MEAASTARRPDHRTRRTLALGAAVLVCAWLGLRAGPAMVLRVRDAREMLDARRALLQRLQGELSGVDALADTAKQLQADVVALAPRILSGTSPAEAANDLVGRVTHAADRSLVKLTGAEPLTDSAAAGGLRRVGVRASFEGDIRGVVGTLRALERDPGALLLDDLRVLSPDPGADASRPEALRVDLTVRGWYQSRGNRL